MIIGQNLKNSNFGIFSTKVENSLIYASKRHKIDFGIILNVIRNFLSKDIFRKTFGFNIFTKNISLAFVPPMSYDAPPF